MNQILLVEDDRKYRGVLHTALVDAGYHVTDAIDGKEALKIAENKEFDLILLDLLLPDVNGLEFYDKFRGELKKETPVIVITNIGDSTLYEKGVKDILIKSQVPLETVVDKVDEYLKK